LEITIVQELITSSC